MPIVMDLVSGKGRALLLLLAAALLLAGCGGLDDDESGDRAEIERFEGLNTPIEVDSGTVFEVVLEANASTGYSWQLEEEPPADILAFEGSSYESDSGAGEEEPVAGAPGEQTLRFRAVGTGETELRLEYLPPGDGPAAGKESGDVTVR